MPAAHGAHLLGGRSRSWFRRGVAGLLVIALTASVLGPATPIGSDQVGSPAHGPAQEWGDAAGLSHEEQSKRGNVAEPKSLRSKYPPIEPSSEPEAVNDAKVAATTEPAVRGYDAATSRELPELRSATQRTFTNADGTRTTEFSQAPVNFRGADGTWQSIDTRLVPDAKQGWHNAADASQIWLAPTAGDGSLTRLAIDSGTGLEFGLADATAVPGQVDGSAVTYPAVRPDADLRLEVTPLGLKETIALRSADAPHIWVFPLTTTGLTPSLVDGSIVFRDARGAERARIPRGFMFDSAYDDRKGEYATSYGVVYDLVPHQGGVAVRMTLDSAWLRAPERVYPVTVDPSVDLRASSGSMYVQRNSDGSNFSRVDGELRAGHATDSGGSYTAASYLAFAGVEQALPNHKIFGARLALTNFHSWSCNARPVTVYPVTQAWTASNGHHYPGPAYGEPLVSPSFAHGYIPKGQTTSPCPTTTETINLGEAGRALVQRWVNGEQANHGFTVRASETDVSEWKKFTGAGTANPPRLAVTYSPYDATYTFLKPVPEPPVTRTQGGRVELAVTNRGAAAWTQADYVLAYRYFTATGTYLGWSEAATLPRDVARGATVRLNALIQPTPPGSYRFEFTMARRGGPFFTDEQIPPAVLMLQVIDVPPVITAQYPPNGHSAPTLTPTFWAKAVDIDASNSSLRYRFEICEHRAGGCFDSGYQRVPLWTVPVGKLKWRKAYQWRVFAFDGVSESEALPASTLLTDVPQPEITAHLGNAPYGGGSGEFDPQVGNYTASAVDATVSTVGPQLSVVRTYNSLDPRGDNAFGVGWSSQYDMRATPDDDGSGNVVVTYPDGQQVRFGADLDANGQPTGEYAAPSGRNATLLPRTAAEGGGWTLTDKSATRYVFDADGRLIEIVDNTGRSVTFTYAADGRRLTDVTSSSSNRSLHLTWSGGRVRTVSTDPVNGDPLTWTYTYDGNRLTSVCDPASGCTQYDYTQGSHYRSTIVDAKPDSYWRLGESEGPYAFSQIALNQNTDKGRYVSVELGAEGVAAGSGDTAATFNGTDSAVNLPDRLVTKSRELTVEMWFRTSAGGPLFGAQTRDGFGTTPDNAMPMLYVGTDGRLRGQFRTGGVNPITTVNPVNDNQWHHVVLSSALAGQTLYLDGEIVGTRPGAIDNSVFTSSQIGFALAAPPSTWPQWGATARRSFAGVIDEVAVYQHPLGLPAVRNHFRAIAATDQMSRTTLPSGKIAATMRYDTGRDRLLEYTDRNGGTWKLAEPWMSQDPENPIRTARVTDPAGRPHFYDYDPLRGRILRYISPLGMETRPEDLPDEPGSPPPVELQGARTYAYDDNGFQSTITDELGNTVTLGHDSRGNVTSRRTCRVAPNDCQTTYFEYLPRTGPVDPRQDKLTAVRDARSSGAQDDTYRTAYVYNVLGQLETQTTPDGAVVSHTYTTSATVGYDGGLAPAGLVATSTDPRGAVTRYRYFRSGDLAEIISPTGLITRFAYDTLGRRTTVTQISDSFPAGVVTTMAYDDLSRPTVHTGPATTNAVTGETHQLRVTTSYDADGNPVRAEAVDLVGDDQPRTATLRYDEHNRVIRTTDAEGAETSFGYDSFGNRTRMVDPSGVQYEFAYTARNTIAEVRLRGWTGDPDWVPPDETTPLGYLVLASFAYDLNGELTRATDAMGRTLRYTYWGDGLLKDTIAADVRGPDGNERDVLLSSNSYNAAGHLSQQTTMGGHVTTFETDATGRLTAMTADPNGLKRRTAWTYDPNGNVTQVRMTGAESNTGEFADLTTAEVVDYGYDPTGRQTSETVHTGTADLTTAYGYDQRGLITSITDPRGTVVGADPAAYTTNVGYDQLGRPVTTTAPPVTVETADATPMVTRPATTAGYDTFGNLTHDTDANDNTWTYAYDKRGRLTTTTSPDYTPPGASQPIRATTAITYDELSRVTSHTAPNGAVTRYTYDQLSRLIQRTDPHPDTSGEPGGVWQYTYTRTGELLSATDPTGARTERTYDDLGRLQTASQLERHPTPGTYTSRFAYDDAGNLSAATAPSGATSTYTYDALDQLTQLVNPAGVPVQLGYDRSGRQVKTTDGEGRAQRTHHDLAGQPTQLLDISPTGHVLRQAEFAYDRTGNLAAVTNPLGAVTQFQHDALNQLTSQVEPVSSTESITTTFGHDAAGNATRYTDGRGNSTYHSTNTWGLPESTIEPATPTHQDATDRTWTTAYDTSANPVRLTAPGNVQRTRTFDLLGRLTEETGSGAETPTTARTYDHDPLGRLITSSAPGGENRFTYNDRGALLSTGGPSGDTNFGYDADGNLTTRTDAAGTATYGYRGGRLNTIQDALTGITQSLDYHDDGRLSEVNYGDGRYRNIRYDDLGRVERDQLTQWARTDTRSGPDLVVGLEYDYDLGDRLTAKTTEGVADAGVSTYGYDGADRLTSWTHDPEDGVQGPTTVAYGWDKASNRTSAGDTTARFDARNRLITDGASTYAYTPRGTLRTKTTGAQTEQLTFDAFDLLVNHGAATYSYDALDRVTTRNGTTFKYTGASNELATDGTTTFSRGPGDELLALAAGADERLIVSDQHGDVIAGFDRDHDEVSDSTAYDPFGKVTATTGAERPIGYQGDYTDPDTGQVNMTARWYDPGTGTFTSRDDYALPISPSSVANRYGYGAAAPTNYRDPTGNIPSGPNPCAPVGGTPKPAYCFLLPGGGIGSGLGPGMGGSGGSSCGNGGLSPEAQTLDCCTGILAFSSCGGGEGYGGGGLAGGWSGALGGSFGPGGGKGKGGSGGAGGVGGAPRPDPSVAARQANRAAAMNNPLPIPGAMLAPLYGDSLTGPVSAAPDIPSHTTSDYQDPVNDVNESYIDLQNSLTEDSETLLGSVADTLSAPTQVTPINHPTDPGAIDDTVGDAWKNYGNCPPAEAGGFHDTCVAAAASPNFEEQMDAEVSLMGVELLGGFGEALSPLLDFLDPTADPRACANGDKEACGWVILGAFPFGKLGRLGRMVDDMAGAGGGGAARASPGTILGDPAKLHGWIPGKIPSESQAVIDDILRHGVEAQGAGRDFAGPSLPAVFDNYRETSGYKLPNFDSAGNPITYQEWGTVQSRANPKPGGERIVTGSDGSVYYTPTHYQTFIVAVPGR